jgi:hypothetical protein
MACDRVAFSVHEFFYIRVGCSSAEPASVTVQRFQNSNQQTIFTTCQNSQPLSLIDMLEVRKGKAAKNYENSFFREFARHLYDLFKKKNFSGVLIGNPFCEVDERLQIDALLITPNVVCIIDFKNFKGKVKLPAEKDFELGLWTTETGEQIRGGSSINPFIQLKNQKRRFFEVSNKYIQKHLAKGDSFNPFHVVRIVCFHGEIELVGKIPNNEVLNFFILDKTNFVEGILDIVDVIDKEVKLSTNSFDVFKKVFLADSYKFDEKPFEDELKETVSKSAKLDYDKLFPDQKEALTEIKSFLENPEQQVFILQGTINSGKTYLIPFIQEIAFSSGIQETVVFASSNRAAKNLFLSSGIENVNSIYSYIYGGHKIENKEEEKEEASYENEDVNENENEEQEELDEIPLEIIPLKKCDNSKNSLFIVDESQLISDSYHQSMDLVFGTGYLLKDFLTFTEIISSKRKIIFIGDPYQLQLGSTEKSPLNPTYLEETYKLKVVCFQLLDKENFSDINKQALSCIRSIKRKYFNSLRFINSNQFSLLNKDEIKPYVIHLIKNNIDGHILTFSNEEAQKVNHWIKKTIIKTGEDIANGDLVLFNNNVSVKDEDDPFAEPKKIYNGQFATVLEVSQNTISETIRIKKEQITLNFKELTLQLNESGHKVKVLSLENYRLNPKAELSKNEVIAFKIMLNAQISQFIKENPFEKSSAYKELISSSIYQTIQRELEELNQKLKQGEKVKGKLKEKEIEQRKLIRKIKREYRFKIENKLRKDSTSKYYKYKNAALLRYGWAMTVHKSMIYKWNEIIFNVEPGETIGKTNENYFRWLYTGITRAKQKVNLINYKPISPFFKLTIKPANPIIDNGQKLFYIADETIYLSNCDTIAEKFNFQNNEFKAYLLQLYNFIVNKIPQNKLSINRIKHHNNQEHYEIIGNRGESATISIYYNNKGHFRMPTLIRSTPKKFGEELLNLLKSGNYISDFAFIKSNWRKEAYEHLNNQLKSMNIYFGYIIQDNYKDTIQFTNGTDTLIVDLHYNGDGFFTSLIAKSCTNIELWAEIQGLFNKIKET